MFLRFHCAAWLIRKQDIVLVDWIDRVRDVFETVEEGDGEEEAMWEAFLSEDVEQVDFI